MKHLPLVVALGLVFSANAMAQGTSPIKVNSISVSPTNFKAGDSVTVTLQLENTRASGYGCAGMQASIHAFKAEPYTVTNQVWNATQAVGGAMAANEKRNVTFTTRWNVPNVDAPTWHLMAWSPACPPDEFGQNAVLKIGKSCTYTATPTIRLLRLPPQQLHMPMMKKRP
jgi:hypothetical protein